MFWPIVTEISTTTRQSVLVQILVKRRDWMMYKKCQLKRSFHGQFLNRWKTYDFFILKRDVIKVKDYIEFDTFDLNLSNIGLILIFYQSFNKQIFYGNHVLQYSKEIITEQEIWYHVLISASLTITHDFHVIINEPYKERVNDLLSYYRVHWLFVWSTCLLPLEHYDYDKQHLRN